MDPFLLVTSYWPQIAALVGVIVWFTRLEGSTKANAAEIARLAKLRDNDLRDAKEAREATNTKLDRIQDNMDRAFTEFRSDIKELLKRGNSR